MTSRRKPPYTATVKSDHLESLEALTLNQKRVIDHWKEGKNLVLSGTAGTGKTFLALYLSLQEVLKKNSEYEKVVLFRSIVPTRDIGYLPGNEEEKQESYNNPYKTLLTGITGIPSAWNMLVGNKKLQFESISFVRGLTLDNCIVVVDEMQNLNFHELDSVITRVGINTRIIFCGDYRQSDFRHKDERNGILKFLKILDHMRSFSTVVFGWEDIVRSDFVREYITTKEILEKEDEI